MANFGYLLAILLVLAPSFNNADGILKCWRCSTDVSNGEFCNDPFDPQYISEQQRYWSYVNCSYPLGAKSVNARPVCKKLVQEIYGKRVVTRSCFYEDMEDFTDKCQETSSSNVKVIYCQTCSSDGCNGASGFTPFVTLLLLPFVLLLKFIK